MAKEDDLNDDKREGIGKRCSKTWSRSTTTLLRHIIAHIIQNVGVLGAVCLREDKRRSRTWHRHSTISPVGVPGCGGRTRPKLVFQMRPLNIYGGLNSGVLSSVRFTGG